jgi:hypothetical protein
MKRSFRKGGRLAGEFDFMAIRYRKMDYRSCSYLLIDQVNAQSGTQNGLSFGLGMVLCYKVTSFAAREQRHVSLRQNCMKLLIRRVTLVPRDPRECLARKFLS